MDAGIDCVVTNYRTPNDLADFLESFHDHTPTVPWTLTIVNVDPHHADRTVAELWGARIADKHGDRVSVTAWDDNVGYAHACNHAAAGGVLDTVAFFNADIVLSERAVDACFSALNSNSRWAVLGPRQVDDQGRITHAGIFGRLDQPKHRGWKSLRADEYDDVRSDAISVSGAAYFVRRSVWDELWNCPTFRKVVPCPAGAMLPTQLFYEESWVSVHAIAHGYRCVYFGPVKITHRWHQAVKKHGLERWAHDVMKKSHELYRQACAAHGIPSD